jgi:hypothetical protein
MICKKIYHNHNKLIHLLKKERLMYLEKNKVINFNHLNK